MASRHRIVVAFVGEAPLRTEGSTSRRLKSDFFSWSNRSRVLSVGKRPKGTIHNCSNWCPLVNQALFVLVRLVTGNLGRTLWGNIPITYLILMRLVTSLTHWSVNLLEKLIVAQIVNKFSDDSGTRSFIVLNMTVFWDAGACNISQIDRRFRGAASIIRALTTRLNIPKDSRIHTRRLGNLKSCSLSCWQQPAKWKALRNIT
jgi:hypothetical protein